MPFVIIIVGLLAVLTAVKGTYQQFGTQLVQDIGGSTGSVSYIYWVSSIVAIGAVGYYSPLQKFSRLFMILIILGMVLSNRGLFVRIQQALQQGPQQPSGPVSLSAQPSNQSVAAVTNTANLGLALNTGATLLTTAMKFLA